MIIYLDTSCLLKLYHKEEGSEELIKILTETKVSKLYLSELTKLEFSSAIWKKIRMKEIIEKQGLKVLNFFKADWRKYNWVKMDSSIVSVANSKLNKYGKEGLRSLDSIQLATALHVQNLDNTEKLYLTSDKVLNKIFKQEKLKAEEVYDTNDTTSFIDKKNPLSLNDLGLK